MSEMLGWILLISYVVAFGLVARWINRRASRLLRERWPNAWNALGRPSMFRNVGGTDWALNLKTQGVRDEELMRLVRWSSYVEWGGLAGFAALGIIYWLVEGRG